MPVVAVEMSQIDRFGLPYVIESIAPPDACPGETITIRGSNFGSSGQVVFSVAGGGDLNVDPKRWSSTEIDVVVPQSATTGELRLNAFTRHDGRCKVIYVYRLGDPFLFQGGVANIAKIWVNGAEIDFQQHQPINVRPGQSATIAWLASAGASTQVHVEIRSANGTVLVSRDGLAGGFGSVAVPIPAVQAPTPMTLAVSAVGRCGATQPRLVPIWVSVPPVLTITYVEVTQGMQADLVDVLAGRGMPTVAHKDTAVRVQHALRPGQLVLEPARQCDGAAADRQPDCPAANY